MRSRIGVGAVVLLGVALLGSACAEDVKENPPVTLPKSWEKFVILNWQIKTDAINDQALYESVNLNGFHVDRKSERLIEFAKKTNWPFYVDHAADKGYFHLRDNVRDGLGKQEKSGRGVLVRPNSFADPATMDKVKSILTENINSAKGSSVVGYALDDEISLGSFCSPIEVDGSPKSVEGYHKFLKEMYGTVEKLNAEYGTNFKDFNEVQPQSWEVYRKNLAPDNLGRFNLSQWCDWHSYMDTQFADAIADMVKFANSLDPNTPCGFVGGQSPNAWGGYDWRKLSKAAQWCEAYDMGGNGAILRSFWGQKRPRVQTFFSSKKPNFDTWFLWYYLVNGNRGLITWPEGWFENGKVADYITPLAATFKEVQGPVSKKILDGEFVNDAVGIYYSHPSIQVTWAMDSQCHGNTWPNRSSSMDNGLSTNNNTRVGWIKTLEDIGIQAKFFHQDHLLAGEIEKQGIKVLILNRTLCLSDAEAAAIKKFAASGGTVIADHLCGVFDEHGKAREKGALDDLFGVKHDLAKGLLGGSTLTELNGEKGGSMNETVWDKEGAGMFKEMAIYEKGLAADGGKADSEAGGLAVVRKGKAVYLNVSPIGYLFKRTKPQGNDWRVFVAGLLKESGIEARAKFEAGGKPLNNMQAVYWKNGDRITLGLVANIDRHATIDSFGAVSGGLGDAKLKIKLSFTKPVKGLKNERTGKDMGDGKDFEDDFMPWEANVYTYTP